MTVTGSFSDPSIGEMLKIGFIVKDDQGGTVSTATYVNEMATGGKQPLGFYGAIGAAVAAGIVEGYPDGTFRPHRLITREEMAAMLVRAARAVMADGDLPDERQTAGAADRFTDAPAISGWAIGDVSVAASQGWLEGRANDRFEPLANATR